MHFFAAILHTPEPLNALVAELEHDSSLHELLERLYKNDSTRLALADVLIVRPAVEAPVDPCTVQDFIARQPPSLPEPLRFLCASDELELSTAFRRFPGRPVHLLFSHAYTHHLSPNLNPTSVTETALNRSNSAAQVIAEVQKAEIDFLLETARARLPPIEGFLYRAPSGDFVPAFLRVGNIQRSRAALDAIFFWLLPHLKECHGIMTDIWSIGSIALNVSRRLSAYRGASDRPCPVEMLEAYFHGTDIQSLDAADRVENLLRVLQRSSTTPSDDNRRGKLLFIFSAINTGSSYTKLRDVLSERIDINDVSFIALFNVGRNECPVAACVTSR